MFFVTALAVAAWILCAYLLGSVPFGLLAGFMRGVDIRTRGSGNIGATNTIRILGKPIGIAVFVLDFLKGFVPVFLALGVGGPLVPAGAHAQVLALCCGGAAVLGHCFPVFLRFRGGKGVAATAGAVLALRWDAALVAFAVFFLVRALTRFVSVSSMALAVSFPLAVAVLHPSRAFHEFFWITVGGMGVALLIIVRHRSNIARILRGEEDRVGQPDADRLR
jgi:glycerol-3-phosphate acyltransferase PlsY